MGLLPKASYGRLVLAVVVIIGLLSAWDSQRGIYQPGWFAGWRSTVWCRTVVAGSEFGNATFFHYPGKPLQRIMDEMHVPPRYRALYLNAEQKETICFESWQAAAEGDILFYSATQDHPEFVEGWTEEDYQRAVLMLHLQPQGFERLQSLVKTRLRLKAQEAQSQ